MTHLIHSLPEVLLCSGVLLAVYALLLERRVPFRWCRSYLLCAMPLAALIPLLRIPVWPGKVISAMSAALPETADWGDIVAEAPVVTAEAVCMAVYLLGAGLIVGVMIAQTVRIRRLRREAAITHHQAFMLVRTRQKIASFSFFHSIYIWEMTPADELPAILAHEASHIAHRHSAERIVMESLKALLWWNPFVWIAARRLTEAEEFEADSDVLAGGYDMERYMNTIFRQLFGYSPEIANSLRDSLTKKRFKMMTTQTTSRYALLRLAGTVPAVIGLLCAFSFTTRAAEIQIQVGPKMEPPRIALKSASNEVKALEVTSIPETGNIRLKIRLTDKDGTNHASGNQALGAAVQVIGSDRQATADDKGIASLDAADGSILKVSYPGYEPATVVTGYEKEYVVWLRPEDTASKDNRNEFETQQKPLYIVDSVRTPASAEGTHADKVALIRGEEAVARYGERGKNGVVLITTQPTSAGKPQADTGKPQADTGKEEPFSVVETMPVFQGGTVSGFRAWVLSQLKYPVEALKKEIQGRVVVAFVVEKDGSTGDIRIVQSPDKSLSEEVIRVMKSAPKWTPGKQRGQTVNVKYTVLIDFHFGKNGSPAE